jgi:hypothetical protein
LLVYKIEIYLDWKHTLGIIENGAPKNAKTNLSKTKEEGRKMLSNKELHV